MEISNSQEFVTHERSGGEAISVRKWQKVCFDKLFGEFKTPKKLLTELKERWLPPQVKIIVLETNTIEEIIRTLRDELEGTDFDINVVMREKKPSSYATQ